MLQPRDIVAVFEEDPESGETIGHFGTVVRIGTNAFKSLDERIVHVFVQGREIALRERDLLATGRIENANPWVDTSCSVNFETADDPDEQRGTYRSRVGSFRFVFRVSDRSVSTYRLRFPPINEPKRQGNLEYNTAADVTLDHSFILRAIGEITGELAVPDMDE